MTIRFIADGCSTVLALFAVGLVFGFGFWTAQQLLATLAININNRLAQRRVNAMVQRILPRSQPAAPPASEPLAPAKDTGVSWFAPQDTRKN